MSQKKHTHWTPKKETDFLAFLRKGNTVAFSAEAVDVSRSLVYERRALDAEFSVAWDESEAAGTETLEQVAMKRATEGFTYEVVDKKGNVITVQGQPSDTLLIFLLKGRRPEVYRENVNINARIAPDLSGLLALARQSSDYQLESRSRPVLPGRAGEDAVDKTGGDSH